MCGDLRAVIRAIILAIIGFIVSRALLEVAHALGWYPEDQLANLLLKSPDLWKVAWVRWSLIAFVAAILGALADYILYRRQPLPSAKIRTQPSPAEERTPSLLRLSVGEDHSYYDIPKHGLSSLTRRFKIRVDNVSPDKSVSSCKVHITDIRPASGYRLPRILKENFDLAAGDHVFIPLASYGEARKPAVSNFGDTLVVIEGGDREITAQHEEPNVITIRATALGTPFAELTCYLWIDASGKFRISESEPPETRLARKVERDV